MQRFCANGVTRCISESFDDDILVSIYSIDILLRRVNVKENGKASGRLAIEDQRSELQRRR